MKRRADGDEKQKTRMRRVTEKNYRASEKKTIKKIEEKKMK